MLFMEIIAVSHNNRKHARTHTHTHTYIYIYLVEKMQSVNFKAGFNAH